jgi:hypothetical protein
MLHQADMATQSSLGLKVLKRPEPAPVIEKMMLEQILAYGGPNPDLPRHVNLTRMKNTPRLLRGFGKLKAAEVLHVPHYADLLFLKVIRADGRIDDYGLVGIDLVTTAGATALADGCNGTFTVSNFKYHGIGTGATAPAVGDTALQTEITTAYNPDNTRATGTGSKPSAKVYQSVGTNTVDTTVANTEYGILSQAATGGGTLLARFTYSVVNLASGDSMQGTFQLTFNDGG